MTRDRAWLVAATVLGGAHAATSLVWALGSTWLLDTVGGELERLGRDGGWTVSLALLSVVALKLVAVALPWFAAGDAAGRLTRAAAWAVGVVLVVYGGVLTIAGLAVVLADVDTADPHAVRWHAFFWDPWFLAWGTCVLAAMRRDRRRRAVSGRAPRSAPRP
ncbi:DUF3995 domain-containing protein [Aeromicrobium endophyticum]|uniref:DUF3995 domain-containing protein n=1 Tax=Aeromicrobium endophyticum TaxID=2292704 RepID=A0A371NZL7_9ACTN|nr:DUF3995 domain-containing protein [Aeromicrobium endophyticum]REK69061.1 DUF3995 domain-containing protein [Aeromicrobium endophyticum]